ncbi:MAG: hypothetical protein ACE5I3_05710 [Phycisphaerae bacterium]
MRRVRPKSVLMLLSGGLLCGFGGSCLPANFFANLAGDVISTTVDTLVSEILGALLGAANTG